MAEEFGNATLDAPEYGDATLNSPAVVDAVSPETAQYIAAKAHYGLGDISPGFGKLFNGISNGEEAQLRQDIAGQYDAYLRIKKLDAVKEIAQQGWGANIEQAQALLDWNPKSNPDTIFEKTFAQKYVSSIAGNDSATTMAAIAQDPDISNKLLSDTRSLIETRESFRRIAEGVSDEYEKQKPGQKVLDFVNGVIPFLTAAHLRNIVADTGSILPGNNLEEQIHYLWALPPEEAVKAFKAAVDKLKSVNKEEAVAFAHAVLSPTYDNYAMMNFVGINDALIVGQPAVTKLAKLMSGAVAGAAPKAMDAAHVLNSIGDTKTAAEVTAAKQYVSRLQPDVIPTIGTGFDPLGKKLDLTAALPTYTNPDLLALGPNAGSLSREGAARIVGQLEQQNALIDGTMQGIARVQRLTPNQLAVGVKEAANKLEADARFHNIQDAVLDIRSGVIGFEHLPAERTLANVDEVLMNLGKEGKAETLTNDSGFPLGPINEAKVASKGTEKIMSAAVRVDGKVYTGLSQTEAYNKADAALGNTMDTLPVHTGFVTSEGRFVNSAEATKIAIDNRQIYKRKKIRKSGALVNSTDFREGELSVARNNPEDFLTAKEANFTEVVVGKPDATLFSSDIQADRYAQDIYGLNHLQYVVRQGPGNTWYISMSRPVDETSGPLRALSLELQNTNNVSIADWAIGYARTPADQVAKYLRNNRLIATTASSAIHDLIKTLVAPLRDLPAYGKGGKTLGTKVLGKVGWDRLQDVLDYYKNFEDYSVPMSRGKWPTTMSELQKDWKKVTGKLASEREQLAFWTVVKINDFDYTLRNYNLYRDLSRQGIENVSIPHPTESRSFLSPVWGKILRSDEFNWANPEDATIAVFKDGQYTYHSKDKLKLDKDNPIRQFMDKPSTQITQLAIPDAIQFKGVLERNPHFIVSEQFQRSPLPVKLVDYNGGGHVIYPGNFYLKQPVIEQGMFGKFYHYGDRTMFNFETRAQADRYEARVNKLRLLMKGGATDEELSNFLSKRLPEDLEYWKGKFNGPNAIFSLDHPIVVTERGSSSFRSNPRLKELYKDQLGQDVVSYPDSTYNLTTGIDKSFLQDRDGPLQTIVKDNLFSPTYRFTTARTLNPLYAMERGIYNATRGLFLNDVKTATVEQWVKQYGPYLTDGLDKVARNPYYQFYHGRLVDQDSKNYKVIASAENARRNLRNFLKTSSDLQGSLNIVNEQLATGLYKLTGESDKIANWIATKDWHLIKHPIDFLSTSASHMVFGFYNPIQAVVQTMGATRAIAIDPAYGFQGAVAALLHNFHRLGQAHLSEGVSEGVLKALDRIAITGGFRPGQFADSTRAMERVGFDHVGREVAWRDSISDPPLFGNGSLDKSYVFFNWGDRNNRMVAWHMAYKRFIDENPGKIMDDRALGVVLNRADKLGNNMTKESNSAIQKGLLSPALKFRAFQIRAAEQMLGNQLTWQEKLRTGIATAVMYGIPVSVGSVVGVQNFYDDITKYMLNNGIIEPDGKGTANKFVNLLHDGVLEHLVTMATGTHYNVSKRYGPGPDASVSDLIYEGIPDLLPVLLGPPGSFLENAVKVGLPFYNGLHTKYNVTNSEILDVVKTISTAKLIHNEWMAINYQKYVSQNKQVVVDDMTKTDAVMMALGLTRKDIVEMRLGQAVAHDQTKSEESATKRALEEYRKMLGAFSEQDFPLADKYRANAEVWLSVLGDVSDIKRKQVWQQALSESPTLATRVNQLLYSIERMPPSKIPERLKKHFGIIVNQGKQ